MLEQKNEAVNIIFPHNSSWVILSPIEQRIKEKIEKVGVPLKDRDIQINYGIKTGCNEAFIIDKAKKDELIALSPNSVDIIRPYNLNQIVVEHTTHTVYRFLLYYDWKVVLYIVISAYK